MAGGTEAFPDLGKHCQHADCNQLDFLPFTCDFCQQILQSHPCPKSDRNSRKVVVCETCSASVETTSHKGEDEKAILEKHQRSKDCDPNKKKKKPSCPVRGCKDVLTFSNSCTCKDCHLKVCLKHRFPADHACSTATSADGHRHNPFLLVLHQLRPFEGRDKRQMIDHRV